jgi:hypothetical protein
MRGRLAGNASGCMQSCFEVGFSGLHCPVSRCCRRPVPELAQAYPAAGQGLDKARIFRRITQRLTDLVDGGVQVVIDINERVRPQPLLQLLPRDNGAGLLQQNRQHLAPTNVGATHATAVYRWVVPGLFGLPEMVLKRFYFSDYRLPVQTVDATPSNALIR